MKLVALAASTAAIFAVGCGMESTFDRWSGPRTGGTFAVESARIQGEMGGARYDVAPDENLVTFGDVDDSVTMFADSFDNTRVMNRVTFFGDVSSLEEGDTLTPEEDFHVDGCTWPSGNLVDFQAPAGRVYVSDISDVDTSGDRITISFEADFVLNEEVTGVTEGDFTLVRCFACSPRTADDRAARAFAGE